MEAEVVVVEELEVLLEERGVLLGFGGFEFGADRLGVVLEGGAGEVVHLRGVAGVVAGDVGCEEVEIGEDGGCCRWWFSWLRCAERGGGEEERGGEECGALHGGGGVSSARFTGGWLCSRCEPDAARLATIAWPALRAGDVPGVDALVLRTEVDPRTDRLQWHGSEGATVRAACDGVAVHVATIGMRIGCGW